MYLNIISSTFFKSKIIGLFIFFLILLLFCILLGSLLGDVKVSLSLLFPHFIDSYKSNIILFEYRLPRLLVGACVGANFAVAGAILQAVSKNDLAAPNMIGINSGASLFAVVSLLYVKAMSFSIVPIAAFVGASFAGGLVYFLTGKNNLNQSRFILSGVAVDLFFQAITTCLLINNTMETGSAFVWLSGSLWGKNYAEFVFIMPITLICILISFYCSHRMTVLHLSKEIVIGLGLNVKVTNILLLLIAIILCASAVCLTGPIGFIGLIIPHLVKALFGYDYKIVIPFSALFGAILVVTSDTIGRMLIAPNEVPVGVIASFIGAPYFIYLILKSKF